MKYFNVYYIMILLCGILLWQMNIRHSSAIISFYGYAENKETEINFNYPVLVNDIHVSEGQLVSKGTPLLEVVRSSSKVDFADEPYRLERVLAEKKSKEVELLGELEVIKDQQQLKLNEITAAKDKIKAQSSFKSELYNGLESVALPQNSNDKAELAIEQLEQEYKEMRALYQQKIDNKNKAIELLQAPYAAQVKKIKSEMTFREEQAAINISLDAPKDGLVGNIYCKEAEHFSSYKTLMSFYEPNPSMIKGFIQEDFIMQIALNDSILVRSTKDDKLSYKGKVIGLGSRVVEIPERLRKRPSPKTYGREIIVSIPTRNQFLQKEKTILQLVHDTKPTDEAKGK